jgi:hypothetical protein
MTTNNLDYSLTKTVFKQILCHDQTPPMSQLPIRISIAKKDQFSNVLQQNGRYCFSAVLKPVN